MLYLRGRYYSSELHRFITEDPAKDGLNWYAYCENNPVMFVDPCGYAPGDWFHSIDDAAIDFGMYINDWSIKVDAECGTYIYSFVVYDSGKNKDIRYYSYAEPYTQWYSENITHPDLNKAEADSGYTISIEAIAHTHAGVTSSMNKEAVNQYIANEPEMIKIIANSREMFSDIDINNAERAGVPNYLVTPTGVLKVYNPNALIFKERTVSYNLPRDPILDLIGYNPIRFVF